MKATTPKPTKKQIALLVSGHRSGANDFSSPNWTVADWTDRERKIVTEKVKRGDDLTVSYWQEKGYEILEVKDSGNRFSPYEIVMRQPRQPKLINFNSQGEAEHYARTNFERLWAAYQDWIVESQYELAKGCLKDSGYLPNEIEAILNQAKTQGLRDTAFDDFISEYMAKKEIEF
jgi:hypothetical protein